MATSDGIHIKKNLIKSVAFRKLSGSGKTIYLLFLTKRAMVEIPKNSGNWICTNDGEIVFTYEEAKKKWGFYPKKFTRALDELINHGFIRITKQGGQAKGNFQHFGFCEEWKRYGKPDFKVKPRKPIYNGRGWTSRKKKFPADKNDRQKEPNCRQKGKAEIEKSA